MSFVPTFFLFISVKFLFKSCGLCVSSINKALSESNCRHNGSLTTADCRSVDNLLSAVPEPAGRLAALGTHLAGLSTAGSHLSCCCLPASGSGTAEMDQMSYSDRAVSGADAAAAGSHLGTDCCNYSVERRCCIAAGCCPRTSTAPVVAAGDRILLDCYDSPLGYPERRCGLRNGRKL